MVATRPILDLEPVDIPAGADERVVLRGVSWLYYEILLAARGESAVPRLSYLEGALEILSPSINHEYVKTTLARLIEAYLLHARIDATGLGSWTLRKAEKERGLEPDECYVFGDYTEEPTRPDLAIEVVWTSGGLSKLAIYRGFGVPEVWQWKDRAIQVFRFEDGDYVRVERSRYLPDLDLDLLARLSLDPKQPRAVRTLLDSLAST